MVQRGNANHVVLKLIEAAGKASQFAKRLSVSSLTEYSAIKPSFLKNLTLIRSKRRDRAIAVVLTIEIPCVVRLLCGGFGTGQEHIFLSGDSLTIENKERRDIQLFP